LADLTFNRCFVQSVSPKGQNEVILVALKSYHWYLSGHLRQENKIRKSMEIAAFEVKSCNLQMLTFSHSDLNIWSYRSLICANSMFLDYWLKDLSTLQISAKNDVIQGRYYFSKMTTEFCQQIGFVKKRVQIMFQSI